MMLSSPPGVRFLPLLLLLFLTGAAVRAQVDPYPRPPHGQACPDHPTVKVNGVPVETVGLDLNVGYVHFGFSGSARVEVVCREEIRTHDLSPHHLGLEADIQGRTLTFTLSRPEKLHLRINSLRRFFVFADPRESAPPRPGTPGVVRLRELGVVSSPDRIQTVALQKALDDAAKRRMTVYVDPGIYRTGELRLKDGLSLYLAPGSILKGTGRIDHYPQDGKFLGGQLIYLKDCTGVRIFGRGVIDADGRALRLATGGSGRGKLKLMRSLRARQCTIEDVILRDSGSWGVHLVESDEVTLRGVKLMSLTRRDVPDFPYEPNTDGIDSDNCRRVLVEKCFISSHDDALCVKHRYGTLRDTEDMVFRDNVVWTVKSALKIGEEVHAGFRVAGVTFEDNDVLHADRGISIRNYCGADIENPRWIGNRFESIGGDIKRMHLEIKIQDEKGRGNVRNVVIRDNIFEHPSPEPSEIRGLDVDHEVDGVLIENLVVAGKRVTTRNDARLLLKRHVKGLEIR